MRYRQIHLDFHTSELIPDIGSRFDADDFAKSFADANVDSVTIFAKCHHGWSYHPTKVGKRHPNLNFDLTRAQLDALHEQGINAPIYITAGWDELAAREHPEWRIVSPDGAFTRQQAHPLGAGWAHLDLGSGYLDHLCQQIEEVMELFPDCDGIFIDICFQMISLSESAKAGMASARLDWTKPDDQVTYAEQVLLRFYERVDNAVHKHDPKMPLFFNSGHVRRGRREILKHFTHLEVESLPTAFWGYEHFPISARYVETLGIPFLGMTGKFHHLWGEVGGYKKPEALVYECAAMLAQGARCSIGDHLHPTGKIDKSTYRTIGQAYAHVKACEPWAEGSENLAEIGVLSVEGVAPPPMAGLAHRHDETDEGVVRLLLEAKLTFDVLDADADFAGYSLLILPDSIEVSDKLKQRIDTYLNGGGRLLITGGSAIEPERGFLFDVGASWHGQSPYETGDYLLPIEELRAGFVDDPLYMYESSQRINATDGASLGAVYDPYFDRAPEHFSGHVNTPSQPDPSGFDAGAEKGKITYFAHPIFAAYKKVGAVAMLEIGERLIVRALGGTRLVRTSLPRAGRVTVRRQTDQNRLVVHLLHATPALRGKIRGDNVQPIADLVTLSDIAVDLAVDTAVKTVKLVPSGEDLAFDQDGGRIRFTVPKLTGHQMVEVAY